MAAWWSLVSNTLFSFLVLLASYFVFIWCWYFIVASKLLRFYEVFKPTTATCFILEGFTDINTTLTLFLRSSTDVVLFSLSASLFHLYLTY